MKEDARVRAGGEFDRGDPGCGWRDPRGRGWLSIAAMANIPLVLTCAGRRIGVGTDQFSIGRTRDNDLPIRNGNVSRRHCMIERRGDDFYIVDQASTTGIELRGCMVNDYKIEDGDVFLLNDEVSVRCSLSPAPLTELHSNDLRVITVDTGPLVVAAQAGELRYREALPFDVRGVLLAGPKGATVFWRDDQVGRSGLARGVDSYSWNTNAFPLLRADAAPDGITLRILPNRTAEPVTLLETSRAEEATWRIVQDLVYLVSRVFPSGAKTGDEIERQLTSSRL